MTYEAQHYHQLVDGNVQCVLCPHMCVIKEGKTGICRVRSNSNGKLFTDVYGFVSSMHFDPIEKKPLFHYHPGASVLSLGTYGCNLRCFFCQNCNISQTAAEPELQRSYYTPEQIISLAQSQSDCIGIAFTYNEPIVWFEYMIEIATLAKNNGLKTVMVSNGYINKEPLEALLPYIDAFSIDLKAFDDDFYSKVTSSKLEPVKQTLKLIHEAGKHLEIVNLLVPGLNDGDESFTAMVQWIAEKLGKETVLHISRYFPNFKMTTEATPISALRRTKRIAEKELYYVYAGNLFAESNDTLCASCSNRLITRRLYDTSIIGLTNEGKCSTCGEYFLKKT